MSVLAFDCGGTTGWSLISNDLSLEKWGVIKGSGRNILDYMEDIRGLYREHLPEIIVIEEVFICGQRPMAVLSLVKYVQTVTIAVLLENKEAVILNISNKTVKKLITGNGNAKKPEVFKCIVERYKDQLSGFNFKDHNDICDSIGLGIVGVKVLRGEIVLK